MAGEGDRLAALLVQPAPIDAVLCTMHVADRHCGGSPDPGEGVDHQPDQRPVAQPGRRRDVDRVEELPGLVGG